MHRQKQKKDIMKFNIHHIFTVAICLRSPKSCEQFLQDLKGDVMYVKKWEYDKDMLR